jgi:acyl-CoA reductase-like NAD-dependent aldehyde dehydrogenase
VECSPNNSLVTDETFGPLFPLLKVASDEEILQLGNKSKVCICEGLKIHEVWIRSCDRG